MDRCKPLLLLLLASVAFVSHRQALTSKISRTDASKMMRFGKGNAKIDTRMATFRFMPGGTEEEARQLAGAFLKRQIKAEDA